MEGDKMLGF